MGPLKRRAQFCRWQSHLMIGSKQKMLKWVQQKERLVDPLPIHQMMMLSPRQHLSARGT